MKVTVKGPGVSPCSIHAVLEDLEKEYGAKIRDLTMYIRFVDENGQVVDPKLPANGNELILTLKREKTTQQKMTGVTELPQDIPLSIEQVKDLLELHGGRPLMKSELEKVVLWVNDYQITHRDFHQVMLHEFPPYNFRTLDFRFRGVFKKKKEKEILGI